MSPAALEAARTFALEMRDEDLLADVLATEDEMDAPSDWDPGFVNVGPWVA